MSSELDLDVCYHVYGWRHLVKATEVTASLAESNGSPHLGRWPKVTCALTACTPGSAPGPMLGNKYGRTLSFLLTWWIQLTDEKQWQCRLLLPIL